MYYVRHKNLNKKTHNYLLSLNNIKFAFIGKRKVSKKSSLPHLLCCKVSVRWEVFSLYPQSFVSAPEHLCSPWRPRRRSSCDAGSSRTRPSSSFKSRAPCRSASKIRRSAVRSFSVGTLNFNRGRGGSQDFTNVWVRPLKHRVLRTYFNGGF